MPLHAVRDADEHPQRPSLHCSPTAQRTPHAPQSSVELYGNAQTLPPLHEMYGDAQVQAPATQVGAVAGHTLPHAPQFIRSVAVSKQAPLHTVRPDVQATQPPETQARFAGQTVPQPPQWSGLDEGLTQRPSQSRVPLGHTQAPERHSKPAAQMWWQAPQLYSSVASVTHSPSHD